MTDNLFYWNEMKQPPDMALKPIRGGRLNGMTDISPQWRLLIMTQLFGPCGVGWKYTIDRQWLESGNPPEVCANTNISLYIKHNGEWSEAIPGTGGSSFITQEKNGIHTSDEAYKMSLTDALSVAMKQLGVGANIYSNNNDFTKDWREKERDPEKYITENQLADLEALMDEVKAGEKEFCAWLGIPSLVDMPKNLYNKAIAGLEKKRSQS